MSRLYIIVAMVLGLLAAPVFAQPHQYPGEEPVDAYEIRPENAGATPIRDKRIFAAFGGEPGIDRLVDNFANRLFTDKRIEDIFRATDEVRFRRTLKEQFCYLLGGPCTYTGRDMIAAHEDQGITTRELNALVEDLYLAMEDEGVPFRMQNKLIAKLAPLRDEIVTR